MPSLMYASAATAARFLLSMNGTIPAPAWFCTVAHSLTLPRPRHTIRAHNRDEESNAQDGPDVAPSADPAPDDSARPRATGHADVDARAAGRGVQPLPRDDARGNAA